jgi:hypothetical protein
MENRVLRARSETKGSAGDNQPEYWSIGVLVLKRKNFELSNFFHGSGLLRTQKKAFFSITPSLQYSVKHLMPVN